MATESTETLEPHTVDSSFEVSNPPGRIEIDTSAPFESVKEAANRFGGMGFWKPGSHKPEHENKVVDIIKLEEQTAQLERDLLTKERETLDVLKELESTKNMVEELKLKLQNEASEPEVSEDRKHDETNSKTVHPNGNDGFNLCPSSTPGFILLELKQAKSNLTKTTSDLADIRSSIDMYNKKIVEERVSLEKTRKRLSSNTVKISSLEDELNQTRHNLAEAKDTEVLQDYSDITKRLQQLSSETEQFKKIGQAAKSRVERAMSEIEQTRARIKTAELKLIAAKKMKEAARASERVALSEIKALSKSKRSQQDSGNIITLTHEEYSSLIAKGRDSERTCKVRVEDAMVKVDEANVSRMEFLKRVEEATEEVKISKKVLEEALSRVEIANRDKLAVEEALRVWRSEHGRKRRWVRDSSKFENRKEDLKPVLKTTLSIGQILSRKLMLTEEYENNVMSKEDRVSLGQMLNNDPYSGKKCGKENKEQQEVLVKRKKFGFGRISRLVAKQSKKKKKKKKKNSSASSMYSSSA